jgi:hypothetical protein
LAITSVSQIFRFFTSRKILPMVGMSASGALDGNKSSSPGAGGALQFNASVVV